MTISVETESFPFTRSHSAEELTTETSSSQEPTHSTNHEGNNDLTSVSTSTSTSVSNDTMRNRRRTWFSSVGSAADLGAPKDGLAPEPEPTDSDRPQGRSTELDTSSKHTPESLHIEQQPTDKEESPNHLLPNRQPRSSSRHSQSQSSSSTEDVSGNIFDKPQTLFGTPSPSRNNQASPSSPGSFLSTLKSRAAATDKQALSNQAKEAMRKWGVNWGGLRRDGGNSTQDEIPDVGPSESRNRTDSHASQKNRVSYADVRAAVVERKEREKNGPVDPSVTSLPVAIPEGGRIKVRNVSVSSGVSSGHVEVHPPSPSTSAVSTSPSTPSLLAQGYSEPDAAPLPKVAAASMSRSSTASHSSDPFSNDRDVSEGVDIHQAPPVLPIHTQPSHAKTMTIPGIHASHRGEVMSMGFVAPPPPPNAENNKIKAPAIQSVYRLWKSPTLSGQQTSEMQSESQVQVNDLPGQNRDVVPLSLNPESSPQLLPRPVPPPLPPRSNTSTTTQTHPEIPQSTVERVQPSSPASEALKSIATKDENKRSPPRSQRNGNQDDPFISLPNSSSFDDIVGNLSTALDAKPPLPPRRIPTSAS